ncbi:uncharacterized protein LOC129976337 isoform X1 [Argiope bruennichi]|uniref:uncharacterized protein LOC129976337 isoform X1 n=1 Tax=Argiope bruennichi TaxID=94029 RepID=UPI00249469C8|nr:uncharacterized protein LOC129976337 isoform X1 [Argiope bruennichi]
MRAKNVTILLISHSTMYAIFDEPVGASYEMQMFQVIESLFQRGFDWDMFKGLKIGQIQIERTDVKRIGSSFVHNMEPTISEITFDTAKIVTIHAYAFAKLTHLKNLVMPHNFIKKNSKIHVSNSSKHSNSRFLITQSCAIAVSSGTPKSEDLFESQVNVPNHKT